MREENRGGFRSLLKGGAVIAVAMGVMNVATYGYTVAAAHLIGPEPFGAFSALMGVLLVVNVVSLGLQATGARRISADPDHVESIERMVLGVSYRAALALGVLCLLLAPVLNVVLRLDSLASAAMVALTAAPLTIMGGQAGVLQGERRWEPLSLVYLTQGVARVVCGVGLMLLWRTEFAAILGVAIGAWVPVLVGWLALRRPRGTVAPAGVPHSGTELFKEVATSSQALLAFFALANSDILLARAVLDPDLAGLYAGGLILVKAILFLPQFIVVIAFPSMASRGASLGTLAKSLTVAAAMGLVGLGGVLVLPDLALVFVGGEEFGAIRDDLWLFAIVGTLLSMVQLLLYSVLARQQLRAVLMIWAALAALMLSASTVHSVTSLVTLVCTLDGLLLAGLLANAWLSKPAAAPSEASERARV
ncbi:oligosaccharide flippase family protein [Nocardioides ferulae]|uniref:oligosaccharide flippase family protein n=1 Tax=Nocardioides ferulae TaxID=2340821 RepID=UPI000EB007C7|nr:oligosaccharide flippase family protein [Nocardioides ferulae]